VLLRHADGFAAERVAADVRVVVSDGERAKAPELGAVITRQRIGNFLEYPGDDDLDVALLVMRVLLDKSLDQLGFRHCAFTLPETARSVK
jgi:hypothetical protein